MRAHTGALGFLSTACLLLACGADGANTAEQQAPMSFGTNQPSTAVTPASSSAAVAPAGDGHPEVVQLVMPGNGDGMTWFCTGALVSSTVVVTAGHCLQPDLFLSWQVIAPGVSGRPRVDATPAMYDSLFTDPAHPDLGVVVLATPIELPRYAELVDVSAEVDGGQTVVSQALVRTKELPEAPLALTTTLPVTSTKDYGYLSGYGVPLYSHGGDSGAGLFLVENGQMTHKVIGVEREPDPDLGLDHLSRIDAAFIAWVANPSRAAAAAPPPVAPTGGKNKKGG